MQTHQSRQPSRVVGYIKSKLSALYPMAGLSINTVISTARAGTRVISAREERAGLDIILWDELGAA